MNQKLNNTCIKCLSKEHGAEIVKFYGDNGVENAYFIGSDVGNFYGVLNWSFGSRSSSDEMKLLTLQEAKDLVKENQYPKVMWVKNNQDTQWVRRVVFAYKCEKFISWVNAEKLEDAENYSGVAYWDLAKDNEIVEENPLKARIEKLEIELNELKKLI